MRFPSIHNIYISDMIKNNVRIATVQLNYTLSEEFPYIIEDENKEATKQKIINVLETARKEKVDILCLPELCNCEEWLSEIRKLCQKMIVISGTYYDKENHNICRLITDFDAEIPPQLKITPSDFEESDIMGQRMVPGENILNIYESPFGKFAVLICRDFGKYLSDLKNIVDVVFCPSYNEANGRFHSIANSFVTDSQSYIVISNTARYGGTSIFGIMKKDLFSVLVQNKCKEKGDDSYKLCQIEAGKEGMIVADFDLINKSPLMQSPMDDKKAIKPIKNIKKILF